MKVKNPTNRSLLRRQIPWCNKLANKDKSKYYKGLINDNSHDSQKLWHELNKTLNRTPTTTLPAHESDKTLADQFENQLIMKIRDSFSSSESENTTHPPYNPPLFSTFAKVSEDEVNKIISDSPTKSCMLDLWPTFLVKDCLHL